MMAPFQSCLYDKHNPFPKNNGYNARLLAGTNACIREAPLPPWQLDPANPQARGFIGQVVTCLQKRGYHASAALSQSPFGSAFQRWTVNYTPQIVSIETRTEAAQAACQHDATE